MQSSLLRFLPAFYALSLSVFLALSPPPSLLTIELPKETCVPSFNQMTTVDSSRPPPQRLYVENVVSVDSPWVPQELKSSQFSVFVTWLHFFFKLYK